MRQATILARLVPDTPSGRARVLFVTAGEASLHFALRNNVLSKDVKVSFYPKALIGESMLNPGWGRKGMEG
jgi:hypothetical protein